MEERVEKVCREAIDAFGKEHQKRKAIEEMGELAAALMQYEDGRVSEYDVASEIADVLITTSQLGIIFGIEEVTDALEIKLERLHKRAAKKLMEESRFVELMKGQWNK